MPEVSPSDFERLLVQEIGQRNTGAETRLLFAAAGDVRVAGATLFLQNVLDQIADHEYLHGPDSFLRDCGAAVLRLAGEQDGTGPEITGLLALICLNAKLLDRRFQSPDREEQLAADAYCRSLFEGTPIRRAIAEVYRPPSAGFGAGRSFESARWDELDFESMSYFKAGTTSFILLGHERSPADASGAHQRLVLKCVLFPWNKLTAIAQATDSYAPTYGAANTAGVVVHPIASSSRWVLMPFQEGPTLAEHLAEWEAQPVRPSAAARVAKAREVARQLTRTLDELAGRAPVEAGRPDRQHLDLSPNNILMVPGSGELRLIDLGVNHLYSRQVGIAEHDDSVYTAPEIKNRGGSATADAYSVGVILTQILCGYAPRDSRVPIEVWEISPLLGRALDDLIEEDHHRRLLLEPAGRPFSFGALGRSLDHTFELVMSEPEAGHSGWRRVTALLLPTSREVRTQFGRWLLDRHVARPSRHGSYLLFFSLVSTWCWWFTVVNTAFFQLGELAQLKVKPLPHGVALAAVITALTQGLLAAKAYQTILARLTARGIPGGLAKATEICMRTMTVLALPSTILAVLWKPWLWAYCGAAAAYVATLSNYFTLTLANRIFQAGRGRLSSVPPRGQMFSRGYEQWWWTMLLYAIMITVIAAGLQHGWLKDMWGYVAGFVTITVGIHYISKCVLAGPTVRGELARAFATGERLTILRARGHLDDDMPWPPRLRRRTG